MSSHPLRYVPGCSVEYRGPTNTQGGKWAAVIKRGRDRASQYRITTPFAAGPDAAARAAVARLNAELLADRPECDKWVVLGAALSMDGGDRYAYPVGPRNLAEVLSLAAP
jgi:hypothetical protein